MKKIILFLIIVSLMSSFVLAVCSDSDGGFDQFVQGTVTENGNSFTDFCENDDVGTEYFCNDLGTSYIAKPFYCFREGKVCSNGACVVSETCSDSDSGRNYYEKGTFSGYWNGNLISNTDTCLDSPDETGDEVFSSNYLGEAYCKDNQLIIERITCPNGCRDGVCLDEIEEECIGECSSEEQQTSQGCTETDGGNQPKTFGSISFYTAGQLNQQKDYCVDNYELIEYYCEGNTAHGEQISCADYGMKCRNGMCTTGDGVCEESDGGIDYFTQSYTTDNLGNIAGDCCKTSDYLHEGCGSSGAYLHETYCKDDNSLGRIMYLCPAGCQDGACLLEIPSNQVCTDSDAGIKPYQKGIVSIPGLKDVSRQEDHCYRPDTVLEDKTPSGGMKVESCSSNELCYVIETYCSTAQTDLAIGVSYIPCPGGCSSGECLASQETVVEPKPTEVLECASGCVADNNLCLPIGTRTENDFCSLNKKMEAQRSGESNCNNNFECQSNLCIDSQCVSKGLWQRIMSWFRGFF